MTSPVAAGTCVEDLHGMISGERTCSEQEELLLLYVTSMGRAGRRHASAGEDRRIWVPDGWGDDNPNDCR
jgi:hypothetical protein